MEELSVLAAVAVTSALALAAADIVGWLMGLGWGHYSRKARARLRSRKTDND
jgi:hypothetical protein